MKMTQLSTMLRRPRTCEEIERAINRFDLDHELWLARAKQFVFDQDARRVVAIPRISGGSFLTGTCTELIYSNAKPGTAKNTFTTEFAINDTAGMGPQAVLPAWFFQPTRGLTKAIRIVARGIQLGTGSTPPTWLWTFRMNPVVTPANPPTGPIVCGGTAATTGTTTTNTVWEAEMDVQMTTEAAAGSNSTLTGMGVVTSPRGLASPFAQDMFGGAASPGTVATFDMSLLNTLTVGITCGTSLAANQMQLIQLLMFGLN